MYTYAVFYIHTHNVECGVFPGWLGPLLLRRRRANIHGIRVRVYSVCIALFGKIAIFFKHINIYSALPINPSFLVVALNFVLATLSSLVVSFYNKTLPQRRSHSRVFTSASSARGGGGAQFCYPGGLPPIWPEVGWWCRDVKYEFTGMPVGSIFGRSHPLTASSRPLSRSPRPLTGG
jgi:hypothetical protein